jgi:hypothetical protein
MTHRDDELTAEDLRLVRVMRAIAVEEVEALRASSLTKADVTHAVTEGMRALLHDDQVIEKFWERGFQHLTRHGTDGAQRWIGRRILVGILAALFAAALVFSAKMGTLK